MNNIVVVNHDFGFNLFKTFFFFENKKEAKLYKYNNQWYLAFLHDCFVKLDFKFINNILHFDQSFGENDYYGYIWRNKKNKLYFHCKTRDHYLLSTYFNNNLIIQKYDIEMNKLSNKSIIILNKKKIIIDQIDMYDGIILASLIFLFRILSL